MSGETRIGNVGSARVALVGSRGQVTTFDDRWSLEWWVNADDGWHGAASELGSRMGQRLLDASPVVETTMRVPSGDVLHRAYAIAGAEEFVVVEVTNRSPVPVAVAFAVWPAGGELRDHTVEVDGLAVLLLPKPPARTDDLRDETGTTRKVFVYPLPHTATIRVLLPLSASRDTPPVPKAVPTAEQVASGWRAHARRGMRVAVPDSSLQAVVDANSLALLLSDGRGDPTVSVALDRYGLHVASTRLTPAAVARGATRIVRQRRRKGKRGDSEAADAVDDVVALAGLRAAAELLRAAGESRAAAQAASEADALWAGLIRDRRALDRLRLLLDSASSTWSWSDDRTAAAMLLFVRDLLVREVARGDGTAGLDLVTLVPDDWLGQGVEMHDAPTHHGHLSYAVRWHGERPALLWELTASSEAAVTLRAPGLDPSWSTTEPSGEALLAPIEPPRVTA